MCVRMCMYLCACVYERTEGEDECVDYWCIPDRHRRKLIQKKIKNLRKNDEHAMVRVQTYQVLTIGVLCMLMSEIFFY